MRSFVTTFLCTSLAVLAFGAVAHAQRPGADFGYPGTLDPSDDAPDTGCAADDGNSYDRDHHGDRWDGHHGDRWGEHRGDHHDRWGGRHGDRDRDDD